MNLLYFIVTIAITLIWLSVGVGIWYAFYAIIWKPTEAEKKNKEERLRRINDRRG